MIKSDKSENPIKNVSVVLIGVGGYAGQYVRRLLSRELEGVTLEAVVDPMARYALDWNRLTDAEVPVFSSIADLLQTDISMDLAVVSTPIGLHSEQSCRLLEAGVNVLCEKPMAGSLEGAMQMKKARERSGCFLEIGYQWSFSSAVLRLKTDILEGRFGSAKSLATWVAWPRSHAYYTRNNWAGRKWTDDHQPVFDSPANNATAHYLHLMLFLMGEQMSSSADPLRLEAECYRANAIENFDAICCRIVTRQAPEILFYSAHCVDRHHDPVSRMEFDHAVITLDLQEGLVARFENGAEIHYGNPDADPLRKLDACVAHIRSQNPVTEICGAKAALSHAACMQAVQQAPIHDFPESWVQMKRWDEDDTLTYVQELASEMERAFTEGKLFFESGLPWAQPAHRMEVADYEL